jgi:hypothetical protein
MSGTFTPLHETNYKRHTSYKVPSKAVSFLSGRRIRLQPDQSSRAPAARRISGDGRGAYGAAVPVQSSALSGLDSLLSIVQMPKGVKSPSAKMI